MAKGPKNTEAIIVEKSFLIFIEHWIEESQKQEITSE